MPRVYRSSAPRPSTTSSGYGAPPSPSASARSGRAARRYASRSPPSPTAEDATVTRSGRRPERGVTVGALAEVGRQRDLDDVLVWRVRETAVDQAALAAPGRARRRYSEGRTKRLSSVDVTRPPTMTTAIG